MMTTILQDLLDELIVALRVAMREVVTKLDHVVLQGALHTQVGILIVHQCTKSINSLSHYIFRTNTNIFKHLDLLLVVDNNLK